MLPTPSTKQILQNTDKLRYPSPQVRAPQKGLHTTPQQLNSVGSRCARTRVSTQTTPPCPALFEDHTSVTWPGQMHPEIQVTTTRGCTSAGWVHSLLSKTAAIQYYTLLPHHHLRGRMLVPVGSIQLPSWTAVAPSRLLHSTQQKADSCLTSTGICCQPANCPTSQPLTCSPQTNVSPGSHTPRPSTGTTPARPPGWSGLC